MRRISFPTGIALTFSLATACFKGNDARSPVGPTVHQPPRSPIAEPECPVQGAVDRPAFDGAMGCKSNLPMELDRQETLCQGGEECFWSEWSRAQVDSASTIVLAVNDQSDATYSSVLWLLGAKGKSSWWMWVVQLDPRRPDRPWKLSAVFESEYLPYATGSSPFGVAQVSEVLQGGGWWQPRGKVTVCADAWDGFRSQNAVDLGRTITYCRTQAARCCPPADREWQPLPLPPALRQR